VVKLALVTKLGRESGSMIKATATLGAALIAATIAMRLVSMRPQNMELSEEVCSRSMYSVSYLES
jgi:hypothetical protein